MLMIRTLYVDTLCSWSVNLSSWACGLLGASDDRIEEEGSPSAFLHQICFDGGDHIVINSSSALRH